MYRRRRFKPASAPTEERAQPTLEVRLRGSTLPFGRPRMPAKLNYRRCNASYCEVKIAFRIIPWIPLVPSTTGVT
jgi:hypothetical protein